MDEPTYDNQYEWYLALREAWLNTTNDSFRSTLRRRMEKQHRRLDAMEQGLTPFPCLGDYDVQL